MELSAQLQNIYKQNEEEEVNNFNEVDKMEITDEQRIQQDSFLKQFTEFSPSRNLKFLTEDYEFRLIQNVRHDSNQFQDIFLFYKNQHQNSEKIKNKILSRLKNNLHYSINHLSLISNFFKSYSSYQNYCYSAQMILNNQSCENPPYQIFEHAILNNILNTHRLLFLKNLLIKFKHFPLIRRREILSIAANRFFADIKKESNSIPIASNSEERIITELSRLSQHLGINFDVDLHDGQHFIYECETLLSDFQRLHFSFNLVKNIENKPSKLIDCINKKFMDTFPKEELIVEAFENIINPSERYKVVVFNAINNKSFSNEQIQALVSLRFCRNRQLLLEIESFTKKLCKYRNLIYENFKIELTESDETFCNKYISFIVEQVLVFTSAIYVKSDRKGDLDPLIENSLEKQLRYLQAKIKILMIFYEISRHSDSIQIKEYSDQIIEKNPNLVFTGNSFYELFEIQIETLETIGKTLSIILNLQILTERQITSFYGSFYEPFQFGTFYSKQGEGDFNVSNFEVYPNVDKILQFFAISTKTVEDICSTMSIKSIEYSDYVELAVWTQLMNEVSQYPELSLFGTDYSSLHFNLNVSKDVKNLMNCQILDDPLFLKQFISKIEDPTQKLKFTQNLANFCLLALKLRTLIYKTNLYLPLYIRQHNEANFSVGSTETIEFIGKSFDFTNYSLIKEQCLNGDFSDLIELINLQRRYNIVLRIAIQYNNFRSDNYCISFLFNIASKDNLFFITKSETQLSERAKFYKEASKRFFVEIDSIINQDFSSIFFDISEITDFSNPQKIINESKKYLNRIELASITNFERILLHDFQEFDFFTLNGQFYKPSENFVDYFVIPNFSQCLSLDLNPEQFDQILNLISTRLRLISFVRLNSFLKLSNNRSFDLLYKRQINWESTFFSKLHSSPKKSLEEALITFKSELAYESAQFELSILLLAQKVFMTKRACHLQGHVKPTNLSLISDDEIRNFWKLIHHEYLINSQYTSVSCISVERYIPAYLSKFNFSISDKMKVGLLEQMDEVKTKVERNIIFSDQQNYIIESSAFIMNELVNELLKFTLLRLQAKVIFTELNIVSIVDITRKEYKENMPFYSNYVVVPSTQNLPNNFSNEIENGILNNSIQYAKQTIIKFIEEAQKKENYEKSIQIAEQLEVFNSLDSPLKPECYTKKKQSIVQKREPYNPNPIDAQHQFEQEMRYARSKIASMIVNAIKNNDQQLFFNLDQNNQQIFLNFDSNSLVSKLIPLSSLLFNLIERSRIQILKTWLSYTEKMKDVTFQCDEQTILLNDYIKLFKEHYNMQLDYQLSIKINSDYLKISSLRSQEKLIHRERSAYEEEITKDIRKEYEEELRGIEKEQQEVKKQFPIIHNRYFSKFDKVIQKQYEKVPENNEILKPNHEIANLSLQISEESKKEMNEIKHDEEVRKQILMKEDEERKMEEKEFEEQAERKKRQLPTFDFTSSDTIRTANTPNSPTRIQTSRDDSSVVFQPQSPRLKLNSQNQFKRRHTMLKPKAQASLLEATKPNENMNDNPTFSPKRHTNSVTSKRSKELLNTINKDRSDNDDLFIKNRIQSDEKLQTAEEEIDELKKKIIKLRITKCLSKIGCTIHFTKAIEQASHERKEASMLLWLNRKSFEEDTREIKDDIANCFKRLSECEKESDNLKQELASQKAVTTKLAHWKELSLRSSDRILKQIGVYEKGPNIEVSKLLKKLAEKREELDSLNKEAEEFEAELIEKVRQPMEEMSRIRKLAQRQQYNNFKMMENMNNESFLISSKINILMEDNKKIKDSNEKLKFQIKQLEDQLAQIPSDKIEATSELFQLNQPSTARRMKTSYVSQRSGKKALTAKSPYARIGYKSIKKPLT